MMHDAASNTHTQQQRTQQQLHHGSNMNESFNHKKGQQKNVRKEDGGHTNSNTSQKTMCSDCIHIKLVFKRHTNKQQTNTQRHTSLVFNLVAQ